MYRAAPQQPLQSVQQAVSTIAAAHYDRVQPGSPHCALERPRHLVRRESLLESLGHDHHASVAHGVSVKSVRNIADSSWKWCKIMQIRHLCNFRESFSLAAGDV